MPLASTNIISASRYVQSCTGIRVSVILSAKCSRSANLGGLLSKRLVKHTRLELLAEVGFTHAVTST